MLGAPGCSIYQPIKRSRKIFGKKVKINHRLLLIAHLQILNSKTSYSHANVKSNPNRLSSMGTKIPNLTDYEGVVVRSAIASRIVLLTLIILWRSLLTPYDTSAPINPNCLSTTTTSNDDVLFPRAASAIESSVVWDSVYFVRIAQCGYEYEQTYAFLPLLPLCISLLSRSGICTLFIISMVLTE